MKPILDHLTTGPNASLSLPAAAVEQEKRKLTAREKRFIKFSSVEYDGQIYMTPQGNNPLVIGLKLSSIPHFEHN